MARRGDGAARAAKDGEALGAMQAALLAWYEAQGRALAWRVRPEARAAGARPDPYRVWLSEIMLQQTTVAAATPYYERFLARFPTVSALAAAALEDVLAAWAGLGYYARARNLHACAQEIVARGGRFPSDEAGLRALPGVGAYTAAAVAAIAFDQPANAVDANIARVTARLLAIETAPPAGRREAAARAGALVARDRPGDWLQALMDLGALVCTPRAPDCPACPIAAWCEGRRRGIAEALPVRPAKRARPIRRGAAFFLARGEEVLLRRRPPGGLLGGMAELPTTPWREAAWSARERASHAPAPARWRRIPGAVRHVFSHFALELTVWRGEAPAGPAAPEGWWARLDALDEAGLSSVMRKAVALGAGAARPPRRRSPSS